MPTNKMSQMLFILLLGLPFVTPKCMQCASPALQTQWQLTGLPQQPPNLPFHSSCESAATFADTSAFAASTCATGEICFEMVIPVDNQYSYVRGCHKDFIESATTSQQIKEEKCTYSLVTDQKITKDGEDSTKTYQAVAAMRFVKNADGPTVVNAILTKTSLESDTVITTALTGCLVAPQTNCVKYIYYEGTGRDEKYSSCSGAYCTSFEGKLNDRKFVERGCTPISPFLESTCFEVKTNTTFLTGPAVDGSASRSKRSVKVMIEGTQCYCTTEQCNTTAKTSLSVLVATVLVTTAIRFLY